MISMVRMFKQICGVVILALGLQHAAAFSLLGPVEDFQVPVISYNLGGDIGGPHNVAEEFRRNTPVMYYAMDSNFLDYFGGSGSNAIFQAFAIMNELTNVSALDLSAYPNEAQGVNYLAQALELTDLKSIMLGLIVEDLGLAEPERYTWCLHDREMGTPCPAAGLYSVIMRNFDPEFTTTDSLQATKYVNGTLYTYQIVEFCSGPANLADAVEINVDPLSTTSFSSSSVAGTVSTLQFSGGYYYGLTRDDVGGLRYLLRAGNRNIEAAGNDTVTFITNSTTQLLFTSNVTEFVSAALTNDAATLSTLYPNLQIGATLPFFTNVVTTNFTTYLTNFPQDPYGTTRSVTVGVVSTNIQTWFSHQFLNVFITPTLQLVNNLTATPIPGHLATSNLVTVLTTNISLSACQIGSPYTGLPCTNISLASFWSNGIAGDFFILPSNLCSVALISTQLIRNISITNATVVATNAVGTTNAFNESFSQTTFYNFKQYAYVVKPVTCPVNSVGLRQGVENIKFEKRDFDSLLNRFFYPVTNTYVLTTITNNTAFPQTVRRVIVDPDFLITAQDLTESTPNNNRFGSPFAARSISYDTNNINPGIAGPGVLRPGNVFTFNKVGPVFSNPGFNFLISTNTSYSEATHGRSPDLGGGLVWGSFDGTTNAPVVYPNGTDLTNLENAVFITLSPGSPVLTSGKVGVAYSNIVSVISGATAPYQWTIPFTSPALPTGLNLNFSTGVISGTPTMAGTYDFVIRMTDAAARYVDRPYEITIAP